MKKLYTLILITAGLLAIGSSKVLADVTLTESLSMDMSHVKISGKAISSSQKRIYNTMFKSMSKLSDTTIYASNTNMRIDNYMYSIFLNKKNKAITISFPDLRQYFAADSDSIQAMNDSSPYSSANIKLKNLHKTAQVLGHNTKEYAFMLVEAPMKMSGTIWVCSDFPELVCTEPTSFSANTIFNIVQTRISGIPLKMVMTTLKSGDKLTGMKTIMTVTSLSRKTIPAETFTVPSTFTSVETDKNNFMAKIKDAMVRSMTKGISSAMESPSNAPSNDASASESILPTPNAPSTAPSTQTAPPAASDTTAPKEAAPLSNDKDAPPILN